MDIEIGNLIIGAIVSAIAGSILAWISNVILNSAKRFNGWWDVRIKWYKEWGNELGSEPISEATSFGNALISSGFGLGKKNIRALSYWYLRLDGEIKSTLCVEFVKMRFKRYFFRWNPQFRFLWIRSYLTKFELQSKFRKPRSDFNYKSPFYNYVVKIEECKSDRLFGYVEADGMRVGEFNAEKIG